MKTWFKVITILFCPLLLLGCATIVSGRSQKVSVNTNPDEAIITINGMVQKSPCFFILDRTIPSYQVKIEKEGYKTVILTLEKGINGWVFGNIIFGGIIGVVIDCVSGSVNSFNPAEISQNLVPEGKDAIVIKTK
jgi:hypothetical protein